jgi:hypothetical protein
LCGSAPSVGNSVVNAELRVLVLVDVRVPNEDLVTDCGDRVVLSFQRGSSYGVGGVDLSPLSIGINIPGANSEALNIILDERSSDGVDLVTNFGRKEGLQVRIRQLDVAVQIVIVRAVESLTSGAVGVDSVHTAFRSVDKSFDSTGRSSLIGILIRSGRLVRVPSISIIAPLEVFRASQRPLLTWWDFGKTNRSLSNEVQRESVIIVPNRNAVSDDKNIVINYTLGSLCQGSYPNHNVARNWSLNLGNGSNVTVSMGVLAGKGDRSVVEDGR